MVAYKGYGKLHLSFSKKLKFKGSVLVMPTDLKKLLIFITLELCLI